MNKLILINKIGRLKTDGIIRIKSAVRVRGLWRLEVVTC